MSGHIRASLRLIAVPLWILLCALIAMIFSLCNLRNAKMGTVRLCYRGICFIIGLRIDVKGELSPKRPLLLITNHSSYLDVVVLGALMPVHFTPKAEIARWPLIGAMCRLSESVFIDRRFHQTEVNRDALREALKHGKIISLFPEGTTNDGKRLQAFRSSYFALANESFTDELLSVQPAAITYPRIDNLPVSSADKPKLAWYGDMDLLPHLWDVLHFRTLTARIAFLPAVTITDHGSRKALAAYCEQVIREVVC